MQLAHELARRSAALRFEDLPADAVHWAKVGILDTIGVTLAGSGEPAARIVGRVVPPHGGSSLLFG
jgi:2-methylcitrate dehydratase PrpD